MFSSGDLRTDQLSGGHKAGVCACQEQHKTYVSIDKTDTDPQHLMLVKSSVDKLEYDKHRHNRQERNQYFFPVYRHLAHNIPEGFLGRQILSHHRRRRLGTGRIADTENQHGKDRTDTAQGNQTEAVLPGMLVASDRCHSGSERHDKGHGDRSGSHSAGVKCRGNKILRCKECKDHDNAVKNHEQF